MEKIFDFIEKYSKIIIMSLLVLLFFKSCGIKSECNRNKKEITELKKELTKKDSILDSSFKQLNHKLDSTLISNYAVVNANNATSDALSKQKQQQVIVKLLPNKER